MTVSLVEIARRLRDEVSLVGFSAPVAHVYNPLDYAWRAHSEYLERFGIARHGILLLGMNPGPWGMAQTGVPFGEVKAVRDWLGISSEVSRPDTEHPKRPVRGLGCTRSEVSGRRLWGWARRLYPSPEEFFESFFVANYCPLQLLESSGRNLTPDKLTAAERRPLFEACDRALQDSVAVLQPRLVVGVGAFAEARARRVLGPDGPAIGRVLHPSPASPAANRGWEAAATRQLEALGVELPEPTASGDR
jgi:single-strand selective monofunctional uracil DNA glycosylase